MNEDRLCESILCSEYLKSEGKALCGSILNLSSHNIIKRVKNATTVLRILLADSTI